MPYPNEHSCRINSPSKYDEFRRDNCAQKHSDKCIDVIYGIKDGKSETQALRYKKSIWSEKDAKSHCKSRNGTFEPAKKSSTSSLDSLIDNPWLISKDRLLDLVDEAKSETFLTTAPDDESSLSFNDNKAFINIIGPIFQYSNIFTYFGIAVSVEQLSKDFQKALQSNASEIVFYINSPGGQVNGLNDFADKLYNARDKKQLTAFVDGTAASGAYWLASSCHTIVASETSLIGSIGTAVMLRKKMDEEIELVSRKSPNKRPDPETKDGQDKIVQILDDITDVFIKKVARNRGIGVEVVENDFGKGDMFIAEKAIDRGMIDLIGQFENLKGGKNMAITAKYIQENHPEIVTELTGGYDEKISSLEQKVSDLESSVKEKDEKIEELSGKKVEDDNLSDEAKAMIEEQNKKLEKFATDNLRLKLGSDLGEDDVNMLMNFATKLEADEILTIKTRITQLTSTIDDLGKKVGSNEYSSLDADDEDRAAANAKKRAEGGEGDEYELYIEELKKMEG